MKPIKPEEVVPEKLKQMPDEVIEVFNQAIVRNWDGRSATLKQNSLIEAIQAKIPGTDRDRVFAEHWLDVEDIYKAEGWKVEYDKPGHNESYEASFTFKKDSK